ncbi:MAG: sugar-binding domain-containing protein, partial [Mycobacteriales bacterium]
HGRLARRGRPVAGRRRPMTSSEGSGAARGRRMTPGDDQVRLMAKVARMYHERGLRQPQIASELHLSQPRVSRLLKQAAEMGIVRTIVVPPPGLHSHVEDAIQHAYGLREVIVADVDDDTDVIPALGAATAVYLETTLTGADTLGISSWSATLLAAVEAMRARKSRVVDEVVQLVGGVGDPTVQMYATRLTGRLAELTGARPVFMPAPGLVSTPTVRRALMRDPRIAEVSATWTRLTMALVGIGSLDPSPLLRDSGNAIAEAEQSELRGLGAVGDICLRFFDASGRLVASRLNQRVVGIGARELTGIDRRVGVAGGARKYGAIVAALRGGWVNVLITDLNTATRLVAEMPVAGSPRPPAPRAEPGPDEAFSLPHVD